MDDERELLKKIADKLYELFVVNRNAMAVQRADGNYVTKYTKVTVYDVFCMLVEGKSIGSYQQLYKSPYLKWICFDFDCKEKENPDIFSLYEECTYPLNQYLEEKKIAYINEFSGRRGIHTWILFDEYVTKQKAYDIVQTIKKNVDWRYDKEKYGLDEFPATRVSKGNVVGKQVKIPLSKHQKGGMSYFFLGKYQPKNCNDSFYIEQLAILNNIKLNRLNHIIKSIGAFELLEKEVTNDFKKTFIATGLNCDANTVIEILSKTEVYRALFERVLHGETMLKDWFVMLGTLGKVGDGHKLLMDVFKFCPTFSEDETNRKIERFEKKYFPASFRYLYDLYDMEMETNINPSETGLQYLIKGLGIDIEILEWQQNESILLCDSKYTVNKETNYLFSNDEVPVISIYHDLKHMKSFDTKKINDLVKRIKNGELLNLSPREIFIFDRTETDGKIRKMVSLSAYDRVLTSHLALNLFYKLNNTMKSYSYNPNYLSKDDMFFHWYTSWGNYLAQIRKYLEIDYLYENYHVITLDIKHFYDSIDFMGVYSLLKDKLTIDENNIFMALISYNENLMSKINNTRKGVPQGPAYARIIAEVFLGTVIQKVLSHLSDYKDMIYIYRYVDDIIIFHDSKIDSRLIYNNFESFLDIYGLELNRSKSKIFGAIKNLSDEQKAELLRKDQFQYGLRVSDYSYLTEDNYIKAKVNSIILRKGGFKISDISFFFSKYADERAKRLYFFEYATNIFKCGIGRGSGYQLFYRYIFETMEILEYCIKMSMFQIIPINTINFSCLLAIAFYAFEENIIPLELRQAFIDRYIKKIDVEYVAKGEDKSIIYSLSKEYK